MKQIGEGLSYLTSERLVHGNLNTANVLVFKDHDSEEDGKKYILKLTDFKEA
jgi:hypothetical protein